MKLSTYMTFFLFISSSFLFSEEKKADLFLLDRASVEAPLVNLGKIAKIESDDADLAKKISSLEICDLPLIGNEQIITKYKISQSLKTLGLEEEKDFEIHGLQTIVTTQTRTLSTFEIKELINNSLKKDVSSDVTMEIDFIKVPYQWNVPQGEGIEFLVKSSGNDRSKNLNVSLKAIYDGKVFSSENARINVTYSQDAWVLNKPLNKGDKLQKEDLSFEHSDITNSPMMIHNIEECVGMEIKRNLSKGVVVQTTDLEAPICISKGSFNRLVVVNDGLVMTLNNAEALKNGKINDLIPFRSPIDAKEILQARVVKTGVAIIELK